MEESLSKEKRVIISEAAEILGVSIDTIRRWDKSGILHSTRPDGKTRYFAIEELEKVKFAKPLSISEAAGKLGISVSTLRRIEKRGLITPERNGAGERLYSKESLEQFLNSEYFLRQKEVQEKILEPLKEPEKVVSEVPKEISTKQKILGVITEEHQQAIVRLMTFRKMFYLSGLFLATAFALIVIIITIFFLLFPEDSAKFFGYYRPTPSPALSQVTDASGNVLGAKYSKEEKVKAAALGQLLKPFSKVSLGLVKQIDEETYSQVIPKTKIEDVNDILTIDEEGNISPIYNVKFPDSSYLKIPDAGLVENLNADWLRGRLPGDKEGIIVIFDKNDSTVAELRIGTTNIIDEAISTEDLADASVTSAKLASGINLLGNNSVKTEHIKDGEVKEGDIAGGAVTGGKISDNTIDATDLAATLTFADGDFLNLAAIVHDDTAVQGLRLPNASSASPSSPTSGEGYIAWDTSGNQAIVYNGSSWSAVGAGLSADSVLESHLKAVDAAGDEECLTYESTVGDFEWQSCGGGSQTPWASDIDADNFSLLDLGTNITSRAGLTIATTTTSALTLDSGTTGTVNLGTGNNAKTVNIGTGTAGNTINIGTNNTTLDTINIGSVLDSLALTDADWSITTAGAATFASTVTANGTLDANGVVTLGDGGDAITIDGSSLALQTTGAGSDITLNAVDQIILTDFTTCTSLETIANVLTCGTDAEGSGGSNWRISSGALSPINDTLDLLIGNIATSSARFAVLNILTGTPTASASAGAAGGTFFNATGTLATTARQTLTLGGGDTGNITIDAGSGQITLSDQTDIGSATTGLRVATSGNLSDIDGNLVLADTVDIGSATTGINVTTGGLITDSDGNVVIGDAVDLGSATTGINITTGGLISDSDGNVVIGDAVDLGSATTGINITTAGLIADSDGNVVINDQLDPNTDATFDLGSTTLSWRTLYLTGSLCFDDTDCISSTTSDPFWQQASGAIFPNNQTVDLILGSAATASAEFAITGINDGTPIASISATTNNNGLSLTGSTATIQSLRLNTLTLGGTTTGNITIDAGSGTITLSDGTTISGALTTTGVISDSDSNLVLDDTVDIGSGANGIRISTTGGISDIDGNVAIADTVDITGALTVSTDATITGGDITGANSETIDIGEADNGTITFTGAGETNNGVINFDLETNTYPTIDTGADTILGLDEDLEFIGSQAITTVGVGSDLTVNAVDQIILTDFANCTALETVANVLTCGADAGEGTSPFTNAAGIIDKATIADRLRLQYGDAGDVQFTIENTTNAVVPTTDAMQILLSGGAGVVTNAVDGLYINIEGTDGTTNTVSALHLDFDTVTGPTGDEVFLGLEIDALNTATSALEYAIRIGNTWDANLMFADTTTVIKVSDTGTITFEDDAAADGNDILVLSDISTATNHTLSIDSNTALSFDSGADTDTDITTASNEFLVITANGTGDLILTADTDTNIGLGDTTPDTQIDIELVAAGQITVDGTTTVNTSTTGILDINGTTITDTARVVDITLANTDTDGAADTLYGMVINIDDNATTTAEDTTYGLYIDSLDNGAADPDQVAEAGIVIDNSDATAADAMDDGIRFVSAGGAITDAIDASDTNIGTALRVDANDIVGTTGLINYTNFDVDAAGGITVAAAEGLDTNAAGALELGKLNATSIDFCNSAACDTISIGNLATVDADAITIGDSLDSVAINSTGWNVTAAGALTVASCSGCGGSTTKYLVNQHNNSTLTGTEVTEISVTLTAGTYVFKYSLIVQTALATTGPTLGINYTGTATSLVASAFFPSTGTTTSTGTVDDDTVTSAEGVVSHYTTRAESTTAPDIGPWEGVATADVHNYIDVEGVIVVSDGGDIELWHASEVDTSQSRIMAGSSIVIDRITAGADLAELYGTMDVNIEAGDVVSLDSSLNSGVKKSDKPYDSTVLGIISTSPSLVMGALDDPGAEPVLVALSGRVPVKVNTENGPIKFGDLLTSSSTPGVAMRATKAGQVIAQAMADFNGEGVGKVLAFVKNDYGNGVKLADLLPGLTLSTSEESSSATSEVSLGKLALAQFIAQKEQLATAVDLSEIVTDRVTAGLEIITPSLVAQDILLSGRFEIVNGEGSEVASIDDSGNAFFAGSITADKIKANQIVGLEVFTDKLLGLEHYVAGIATLSAGLSTSEESPSTTLSTTSEVIAQAGYSPTVQLDLNVLGSLNAQGALVVSGPAEFRGETLFEKLATFISNAIFKGDVSFLGRPTFNKDTAGFALIKEEAKQVRVSFEKEYAEVPVVTASSIWDINEEDLFALTQQEIYLLQKQDFVIAAVNKSGFTILLEEPAVVDLKFSWTAIAVEDARTVFSDPVIADQASPEKQSQINGIATSPRSVDMNVAPRNDNEQVTPATSPTLAPASSSAAIIQESITANEN